MPFCRESLKRTNQFVKQIQKHQTKPERLHALKTTARKPIYGCHSEKVDDECNEVDVTDATSQVWLNGKN